MSQYKPYLAYKDSRVEWLGQVPEHWVIKKISTICQLRNGYPFDSKRFQPFGPQEDRLIRIRDLTPVESQTFTNENCPDSVIVRNGDILIGMDGDFNIIRWAGGMAKLNQRVCALNAKSPAEEKFVLYALSTPLKIINDLAYATTVKHLSSTEVLKTQMAIPPNNEELERLVICLDRETTRIDALVAKKTRFIELLREKRQALITHAVTKGLDPNVKMKDSGVEWLGEVPEHWMVRPIKYFAEVLRGKFTHRPRNDPNFYGGAYPFIQTGDITGTSKYIKTYSQTLNEKGVAVSKEFPKGTLVMAIAANIGDVAILDFDAFFPDSIVGLIPNKDNELLFSYYLMMAMKPAMLSTVTISTQMNLSIEKIVALIAAQPPLIEQVKIVNFIEKSIFRIDALTNRTTRSIELLKERRSALITAAVTGQIDLREAA